MRRLAVPNWRPTPRPCAAGFAHNPQFVIMFVPNEACLHAAFDHDRDLFEYALKSQVVVASPVRQWLMGGSR